MFIIDDTQEQWENIKTEVTIRQLAQVIADVLTVGVDSLITQHNSETLDMVLKLKMHEVRSKASSVCFQHTANRIGFGRSLLEEYITEGNKTFIDYINDIGNKLFGG